MSSSKSIDLVDIPQLSWYLGLDYTTRQVIYLANDAVKASLLPPPFYKSIGCLHTPRNGELKEYIAAGTTKDEFARRVQSVLQPATSPAAVTNQAAQAPALSSSAPVAARTEDPSANSSPGQATPPSSSESQAPQSVLEEQAAHRQELVQQAARLAAQRNRDEEAAKQRHAEEEKAKEAAKPSESASKDAQTKKHSDLHKKKQREAREERQRILKIIQDDKAERHARQAELEAERQAAAATTTLSADLKGKGKESAPSPPATNPRLAEHCAIQVRLLDGSTIRNRFASATDTIKQVRQWVDESRTDGRTPYTFKILLTPLPSKTIDAAEESQSLRALKLAPSATLIIAPAAGKKYTPASYSASSSSSAPVATVANSDGDVDEQQGREGGDNILIRFIAFIMGMITGFIEVVTGFFTTLFSVAGPPPPVERGDRRQESTSSTTTGRGARAGGSRIKGLDRPSQAEKKKRSDDDQQFYNGNSVGFFSSGEGSMSYGYTYYRSGLLTVNSTDKFPAKAG